MTIDVTNGRRFTDMAVASAIADDDVLLASMADGTGVKQAKASVLKVYASGGIDLSTLVSDVDDVEALAETNKTSIATLTDHLAPLIFNNAGAHNAIYRGKALGSSVTSEQYAAISAGTFDDLYIGDYWTIGGVNYRIAAFDYYLHCGDTETTKHHVVLVPDTCLYSAQMNTSNVTTGGYVGSAMRSSNLATAKSTISSAFGSHVMSYRDWLVNAVSNGYSSGGAWTDCSVELMTEQMVYGGAVFMAMGNGSTVLANYRCGKSQLPLFALEPSRITNREPYWLRDVVSATYFANVSDYGRASYHAASASRGVRPAFCIS